MYNLSADKKKLVLQCLVEGSSIRSTERITGVHRDTILRLLVQTGETCKKIIDEKVTNVDCSTVQADEIWCFVKKKEKNIKKEELENTTIGSQYLFIAMCADSKLVISFIVGRRNAETTDLFINDLKNRLSDNKIQLTTDGYQRYDDAVDIAFGSEINYAQTKKHQGYFDKQNNKYVPTTVSEFVKQGKPDKKYISTAFIERQNLTVRMCLRRFTRLTNGFSKKIINLKAALNLHFFYYNFMRIHRSLNVTPAMQVGITDHIWTWDGLLNYEINNGSKRY